MQKLHLHRKQMVLHLVKQQLGAEVVDCSTCALRGIVLVNPFYLSPHVMDPFSIKVFLILTGPPPGLRIDPSKGHIWCFSQPLNLPPEVAYQRVSETW